MHGIKMTPPENGSEGWGEVGEETYTRDLVPDEAKEPGSQNYMLNRRIINLIQ